MLKALAPIGSDHTQACLSQERSTHTLVPQCGLQHRPFLGVLQDQAATKKVPSHKETGEPRIDVSHMSQPNLMSQFAEAFEREFGAPQPNDSATEKWEILRDTMHRTALATFGKKPSKTHDWFDAKSTEMRPVIEAKRKALIEYKRSTSERNLQILRAARSKVQQTAMRCANEYWTQLSQDIQTAAITGNIRGMHDGIEKALVATQSKTAPSNRLVGR